MFTNVSCVHPTGKQCENLDSLIDFLFISGCNGYHCGGLQKRQEILPQMHHRAHQPGPHVDVAGNTHQISKT